MQQTTINQRLKFLIETLGLSVRVFSESIGESGGNTNNYIGSRQLAPKHEYLAKVLTHYSDVDAHWLITGIGNPFREGTPRAQNQTNISGGTNSVATGRHGTATTNNYHLADCEKERDTFKAKLEKAEREIELLTTIIQGKDEMLDLLRGGFNRPN